MSAIKQALCFVAFWVAPAAALAEEPLSAIDWLSKSVATGEPTSLLPRTTSEPPISTSALPGKISILSIDGPMPDALGLLPVSQTGLPYGLWGNTSTNDLTRLVQAERVETLPAIQSLLLKLLLAELAPPKDATALGQLFLARVDKLLDLGALDQALALLDLVEKPPAEVFRRWFDVALLLGEEDRACSAMVATPEIAPTFPARIFCLARSGDWNAAALSLRTGEALGYIDTDMAERLSRFLDPELSDGEPDLTLPSRPSPLVFRLMEAIGQPLQTTTLPLAFSQADLRSNAGWKTRLEAGERLARTGAIGENQLIGLYTEQKAAASGGVWERVKAIQALDKALASGDPDAVSRVLPVVWSQMVQVELEVPFANFYGPVLSELSLPEETARLAFRIRMLSDDYESAAIARKPENTDEAFFIGIARGDVTNLSPPDQLGNAIMAAFRSQTKLSSGVDDLLAQNKMGQAMLMAIDDITEGARGDLRRVTAGLLVLRKVGLESTVRRAALELLLLERRG